MLMPEVGAVPTTYTPGPCRVGDEPEIVVPSCRPVPARRSGLFSAARMRSPTYRVRMGSWAVQLPGHLAASVGDVINCRYILSITTSRRGPEPPLPRSRKCDTKEVRRVSSLQVSHFPRIPWVCFASLSVRSGRSSWPLASLHTGRDSPQRSHDAGRLVHSRWLKLAGHAGKVPKGTISPVVVPGDERNFPDSGRRGAVEHCSVSG